MNPEILIAAKKNRWSIVASIAAGLSSIFTLTFLILIWFVWKLPEIVGGWNGIKLNPWSLIDITILMTCAIGIWFQRSSFALALSVYQLLNVAMHYRTLANNADSAFGMLFALAQFALYLKAFFSLKETNKHKRLHSESILATTQNKTTDF